MTKEFRQAEYEQEKALREKNLAEDLAHPENYRPHPEIASFFSDELRLKIASGEYKFPEYQYESGKLYPDEYSEYYKIAKEAVKKASKEELKRIAIEYAYMHIFLENNQERLAPKIDYGYLLNIIGHAHRFGFSDFSDLDELQELRRKRDE